MEELAWLFSTITDMQTLLLQSYREVIMCIFELARQAVLCAPIAIITSEANCLLALVSYSAEKHESDFLKKKVYYNPKILNYSYNLNLFTLNAGIKPLEAVKHDTQASTVSAFMNNINKARESNLCVCVYIILCE